MNVHAQIASTSKSLIKRQPIVVLLGHVDHGKTTLLSSLKNLDLTKKEFGGISQNTQVYQVIGPGKLPITFIDTPGHEAFAKMRSRGAKIADLALLVIAAEEGIKPQTRESLAYILEEKLPFFVVINKVDLENARPEKVKSQLAEEGVLVEDLSGKIVCLKVSAKTKKGLEELLEMILLFSELEEIKADPKASLEAVVVESSLDSKKGPVATLLVKNGVIKAGREIFCGKLKTKVRAIFDDQGKRIKEIIPGQGGTVLGFDQSLEVGAWVRGKKEEKRESLAPKALKPSQELASARPTEKTDDLKIILKTDTLGTLQAIEENLPAKVMIIDKNVGAANESDVLLAAAAKATIATFKTSVSKSVQELAKTEKVALVSFQIIYELFDWLEKQLQKREIKEAEKEIKGQAEVIAEFQIDDLKIAGGRMIKGEIEENDQVSLQRGGEIIAQAKIKSLKHKREAVPKARTGREYGFSFMPVVDFKKGDMIISYKEKG